MVMDDDVLVDAGSVSSAKPEARSAMTEQTPSTVTGLGKAQRGDLPAAIFYSHQGRHRPPQRFPPVSAEAPPLVSPPSTAC